MSLNMALYRSYSSDIARCAVVGLAFVIPLSNTATSILALVLLVACCLSFEVKQLKAAFSNPVALAICVMLAMYIIGTLYSVGTGADLQQVLRKMVRLLLIPLIFPFFKEQKWRTYYLLAFIAAVLIAVTTALYTKLLLKDNIFTSLFVACASFILAHLLIMYPKFKGVILSVIALLVYYLFFVNIGRTGQVLFIILYSLFCWQIFAKNIKLQAVAVVLLSGLIALSVMLPSTFIMRQKIAAQEIQVYLDDNNAPIITSSLGSRLTFARNALVLIKEKPFFGYGTGSFATAYAQRFPNTVLDKTATVNPHNQYLLTGVELGVPGIIALLAMFALLIRAFTKSSHPHARIGVGIVYAIAFGCIANSWLLDFASMFFFVVSVGMLLGAVREQV